MKNNKINDIYILHLPNSYRKRLAYSKWLVSKVLSFITESFILNKAKIKWTHLEPKNSFLSNSYTASSASRLSSNSWKDRTAKLIEFQTISHLEIYSQKIYNGQWTENIQMYNVQWTPTSQILSSNFVRLNILMERNLKSKLCF